MSHYSNSRHRRGRHHVLGSTVKTIATTAVVAYGAYKAYEYLRNDDNSVIPQWLSSMFIDDEEEDTVGHRGGSASSTPSRSKKPQPPPLNPRTRHRLAQQGIRKCRQEIHKAYATCWPAIQQVLEESTNTVALTQELRALRQSSAFPERQEELWQDIQMETLVKFVATQYASSLLVLSLTLQLHWIGGQVFGHQQQQQGDVAREIAHMAQHVMMQCHDYFKTQGVPLLIAAVRSAIAASPIMMPSESAWKPTTFISLADMERALDRVDAHLEKGGSKSTSYSRNWIRIILPDPSSLEDDSDSDNEDDDDVEERSEDPTSLSFMLESFWDLAESPAWQDAKLQAIQTTRAYLRDKGWGSVFQQSNSIETDTDKESKVDSCLISRSQLVPLAKIIAPLKSSCGLVAAEGSAKERKKEKNNSLLSKLQKLPTVLELGEVSFLQT